MLSLKMMSSGFYVHIVPKFVYMDCAVADMYMYQAFSGFELLVSSRN